MLLISLLSFISVIFHIRHLKYTTKATTNDAGFESFVNSGMFAGFAKTCYNVILLLLCIISKYFQCLA